MVKTMDYAQKWYARRTTIEKVATVFFVIFLLLNAPWILLILSLTYLIGGDSLYKKYEQQAQVGYINFRKALLDEVIRIGKAKKINDEETSIYVAYINIERQFQNPLALFTELIRDIVHYDITTPDGSPYTGSLSSIPNSQIETQIKELIESETNPGKLGIIRQIYKTKMDKSVTNFISKYGTFNNSDNAKLQELLKTKGIVIPMHLFETILTHFEKKEDHPSFDKLVKKHKPETQYDYIRLYLENNLDEQGLGTLMVTLHENDLLQNTVYLRPKVEEIKESMIAYAFAKGLENKEETPNIESMTGHEFEHFLKKLFTKMSYNADVTRGSGDQGADLIIEKHGIKTAVQAKQYNKPVTNKAIQEVVAAKEHYNCDDTIVVTTSTFTKSAQELARSNQVTLWDGNKLNRMIREHW